MKGRVRSNYDYNARFKQNKNIRKYIKGERERERDGEKR